MLDRWYERATVEAFRVVGVESRSGDVSKLARMASEPAERVLELAERALELAGRALEPAGKPFEASWEARSHLGLSKKRHIERTEHS